MPFFRGAQAIVQDAPVIDRMTETPVFVWCGGRGDAACPEPTVKTLDPGLPPLAMTVTAAPPSMKTRKGRFTILFKFDHADLTPYSIQLLEKRLKVLAQAHSIQVRGYTDSIGKHGYNDRLAHRRAEAVQKFMISRGIAASKITTEAEGRCCYIASNKTSAGRRANRRAEVEVIITLAIPNDEST